MENSSYRPYLKDSKKIIYVNTESNHSLSVIKQLPKSIEIRLSKLSANEEIFKSSIKPYKEALTKAGYKHEMRYQHNIMQNTTTTKNQKRNIIWFNLPYSAHVVTKFGKHFLPLSDKRFLPRNKFHKIFNRNTVKIKISHSCIPNMKTMKITQPQNS